MATPGDLDGWVVLPVIEVPSEGDDGWPVDRLSRYRDMVSERFHAVPLDEDLWAHCLFRTPEELENPAPPDGCGDTRRRVTINLS